MATITLGGNPIQTSGEMPAVGTQAPDFTLVKNDLSTVQLNDFKGSRLILNIFPSIDTGVCATSVRKFNEMSAQLANTQVLCISRDLPFAQKRFCGTEGIEHAQTLSDFRTGRFGQDYGLEINTGSFAGLHARAVLVLDEQARVLYAELVPEIAQEPNYEQALAVL